MSNRATNTTHGVYIYHEVDKKKDVSYRQYLGVYTHTVIHHVDENLGKLGPVKRKAEMVVADQEWQRKKNLSVFDKECDTRPSKKIQVEISQLVGKRKREEDDLPSDAPPTKKQKIEDLVAPKVENHPLALSSNIPENMPGLPVTGLVDPNRESNLFLANLMFYFSLVLVAVVL
ncbi:unnamed protein product [Rhizopus stolonifer]